MNIVNWNVNGIRSLQRKGFLDWVRKSDPDILCLQETKAFPEQLDDDIADISGYRAFWNNPDRKGYAGVCIYTKTEPLSVETDIPGASINTEGRVLILGFKDFSLANIYFPNGKMNRQRLNYKLEFYDLFLSYADKMKLKKLIICGDFNTAHKEIDLARPKQNEMFSGFLPEERGKLDELVAKGYADVFRLFNKDPHNYTWWDYKTRARERNVGWRIDYFFSSKKMVPYIRSSKILKEVKGSDHCPISIDINIKTSKKVPV